MHAYVNTDPVQIFLHVQSSDHEPKIASYCSQDEGGNFSLCDCRFCVRFGAVHPELNEDNGVFSHRAEGTDEPGEVGVDVVSVE